VEVALATRMGRRVGPAEGGQPKVRVPTAGDSEGHGEGSSRAIALEQWWTWDALPRMLNSSLIRNWLSGCCRVAKMVVVTVWDSDGISKKFGYLKLLGAYLKFLQVALK
jgi:hypothetical protein